MVCMCGLGDADRWHQELEEGSRDGRAQASGGKVGFAGFVASGVSQQADHLRCHLIESPGSHSIHQI